MTTIKSYTDLEQSKKLAEFLPLESADFGWNVFVDDTSRILPINDWDLTKDGSGSVKFFHAWSLAALFEQLKDEIQLENKQILFLHINKYNDINYDIRYTNSWTGEVLIAEANNLVDACVEMIMRLHELNLL